MAAAAAPSSSNLTGATSDLWTAGSQTEELSNTTTTSNLTITSRAPFRPFADGLVWILQVELCCMIIFLFFCVFYTFCARLNTFHQERDWRRQQEELRRNNLDEEMHMDSPMKMATMDGKVPPKRSNLPKTMSKDRGQGHHLKTSSSATVRSELKNIEDYLSRKTRP